VANLKLEDIDWRKETIFIAQGKTGQDLWLPLTPKVGNAIIQYLKRARPHSKYRELFLLTKAPWTPITRRNIGYIVNRYIQLTGLSPSQRGPHLLRHSFATNLIRRGVQLKEIGDMLGHRDLNSTHLYTKTAVENLREVALEVPEEVRTWKKN
jgi:site-specific recombinase XerD